MTPTLTSGPRPAEALAAISFEDAAAMPDSFVFYDSYEDGVRFIVVKGPASVNAYIGVPQDHPLAGFDYDSIPLSVNGGLTYSGNGVVKDYAPGWYWYGWDHAHLGDRSFFDLDSRLGIPRRERDHGWTPDEVRKEAEGACWDFKKLMSLAERIKAK